MSRRVGRRQRRPMLPLEKPISPFTDETFPAGPGLEDYVVVDQPPMENSDMLGTEDFGTGDDFYYTHRGKPWLPIVRDQLESPMCWAMSVSQGVGARIAFPDHPRARVFSPQSLINGLPTHARADDFSMTKYNGRFVYESSTDLAFKFIEKRGLAREENYRYLGYFQRDRDFRKDVEIVEPFHIPPGVRPELILPVIEDYGVLIGAFYTDERFSFENYSRERGQQIYSIPAVALKSKLPSHIAVVVGVGRDDNNCFLEIQNTYGSGWGNDGFALINLNLFHTIYGLNNAVELNADEP